MQLYFIDPFAVAAQKIDFLISAGLHTEKMKVLIATVALLSLVAVIYCQAFTPEQITCLQAAANTSSQAFITVNSSCTQAEQTELNTLNFNASICGDGACFTAVSGVFENCSSTFFETCE